MAQPQSRTQADLQARLQQLASLPDDSPRKKALTAAAQFKSTWVELGEALVAVKDSRAHKAWGFETFEAYCKAELHLRADTVLKLTRSFSFLQQHAPERLTRKNQAVAAPSLDVVDLLSQAAARTKVSQSALDTIGQQLLSQDTEASRTDALKMLRQSDPDAFRAKKSEEQAAPSAAQEVDLRKALLLAERLYGLLGEQGDVLSHDARGKLEKVVLELRQAHGRKVHATAQTSGSNLVQTGQMH